MLRVGFMVVVGFFVHSLLPETSLAESINSPEQIRRGEYLVLHVAMCVQCHTPRDKEGRLEETRLLQGAPMPVESPFPSSPWAFQAPTIAGLPGWTAEDAIAFLQTGHRADGWSPRPPMPPFRLTPEDAAAVVAYLMSLTPGSP
jgi:mono/diheme cytochrome c family protein